MSGEFSGPVQDSSHKLLNLEQFATFEVDAPTAEFARLLSGRVNDDLVPPGFVLAGALLIYDLENGIDGFTGEPIESTIVKQSPDLYAALEAVIPNLADVAYPPEFASEVRNQVEGLIGKIEDKVDIGNMSLEQGVEGVELAEAFEGNIQLYTDAEAATLAAEYDPSTYHGYLGSAYGDASLEMVLSPFAELGKELGRYYGVDQEGLEKLVEKYTHFKIIGYDADKLPDLRLADFDGKPIYFPTAKLLDAFTITKWGVDAPNAELAGMLTFLMKNSHLGDETPAGAESLPDIIVPGRDPFDMVREVGSLPDTGVLLRAKITRGGNATMTVYDYDDLQNVTLSEQGENGEYQYLHTHFGYAEDGQSRLIEIGYEQPNYFEKDTEPYNRAGEDTYMPIGFSNIDVVALSDGGRLLVSKNSRPIGNLSTRLDQAPWKSSMINGLSTGVVRWFPRGDIEGLSKATEVIARELVGISPEAAKQVMTDLKERFAA